MSDAGKILAAGEDAACKQYDANDAEANERRYADLDDAATIDRVAEALFVQYMDPALPFDDDAVRCDCALNAAGLYVTKRRALIDAARGVEGK